MAELGFPVPPPPPSGTVPEPAAIGGVSYQRFPDPRSGLATTVLPDLRQVSGGAESAKGRRVQPDGAASPESAPAGSGGVDGGRREAAEPDSTRKPAASGSAWHPPAGLPAVAGAKHAPHSANAPDAGAPRHPAPEGPRAPGVGGRRSARRVAGHRAPEADDDAVVAEDVTVDDAASSGRHTVPDELVRASTYRLPADRVFRAKVPDGGTLPEEPTTRLVPKPRQS